MALRSISAGAPGVRFELFDRHVGQDENGRVESGLILRFSILPENGQFDWPPFINFIAFAQNGHSFHSH